MRNKITAWMLAILTIVATSAVPSLDVQFTETETMFNLQATIIDAPGSELFIDGQSLGVIAGVNFMYDPSNPHPIFGVVFPADPLFFALGDHTVTASFEGNIITSPGYEVALSLTRFGLEEPERPEEPPRGHSIPDGGSTAALLALAVVGLLFKTR